jgi:hypothetical protein
MQRGRGSLSAGYRGGYAPAHNVSYVISVYHWSNRQESLTPHNPNPWSAEAPVGVWVCYGSWMDSLFLWVVGVVSVWVVVRLAGGLVNHRPKWQRR